MKTVKVTFWYIIKNAGDGSAYPKFYRTEEAFDKATEQDEIDAMEGDGFSEFCGGVKEFEIDVETGKIIVNESLSKWSQTFEEDRK